MGVEILRRYRDYWGSRVDVEFIPFFLGGIMVGTGNRPPASVPGLYPLSMEITGLAKAKYMPYDLARSGKLRGMPIFRSPSVFPVQSYKVIKLLWLLIGSKCELYVL
jgi:glutathione S-transferase kappa 1